jgi:hypothetical protein
LVQARVEKVARLSVRMPRDLGLDAFTLKRVSDMLLAGDRPVAGWQDQFLNVGSIHYSGQGVVLNLRMPRESRRQLLAWAHERGWGITDLLQNAVTCLLDREGVSPDEVRLPWRN